MSKNGAFVREGDDGFGDDCRMFLRVRGVHNFTSNGAGALSVSWPSSFASVIHIIQCFLKGVIVAPFY